MKSVFKIQIKPIHFKLWVEVARHSFKRVKIVLILI